MPAENVIQAMNKLHQCFATGARPLPAQLDYVPLVPVICFSVLGLDWAVPLDEVAELIEIQNCTPLPGVKPWVLGVSNLRGKLLPVVDFAQFLGGQLAAVHRLQRIVVLDRQDTFVGLVVDAIKGMRQFNREGFETDKDEVAPALRPFVQGCYRGDDGARVLLLSPDALVESGAFQDIALA
ncbi:MAG: purine-binding chemotaxis protein CheW [Porticoccaceae bacterium]|nr:purine-binding chemotaxis protein CheW [Porticoccaceae bacterium]